WYASWTNILKWVIVVHHHDTPFDPAIDCQCSLQFRENGSSQVAIKRCQISVKLTDVLCTSARRNRNIMKYVVCANVERDWTHFSSMCLQKRHSGSELCRRARRCKTATIDEGGACFTRTAKIRDIFGPLALEDLEEVVDIAMSKVAVALKAKGQRVAQ